jgi:hypothetical protein
VYESLRSHCRTSKIYKATCSSHDLMFDELSPCPILNSSSTTFYSSPTSCRKHENHTVETRTAVLARRRAVVRCSSRHKSSSISALVRLFSLACPLLTDHNPSVLLALLRFCLMLCLFTFVLSITYRFATLCNNASLPVHDLPDCNGENEIRQNEPIRCKECGHRIMYKPRTQRSESSL